MKLFSNRLLFDQIRALTSEEWAQLGNYLRSGLDPVQDNVLKMYDLLHPWYPNFENDSVTPEALFRELFPGESFQDKKLRYVMSDLGKHVVNHLLWVTIRKGANPELTIYLKEELARRAADKAYLAYYPGDAFSWDSDAPGDADVYYERYQSAFIHLNHYLPRQKRTTGSPIGRASYNLDLFYLVRKLQLLCETENARNVLASDHRGKIDAEIVSLIQKGSFLEVPAVAIYYRIYKTLTEPEDPQHFHELRQRLETHHDVFSREELRDLYQYLMNYCIKKINQGETDYTHELFGIYKVLLPDHILFTGKHLSQWDFKNIVTIGLRCGASGWVNDFIDAYTPHLAPADRNNASLYNRAYYYYAVGDYKKALSALREVEFTDLYYQLDSRAILLKCYYEMDDEEALFYHLSAFRLFLTRNKLVSEYQRTTYRNLVRFTSKLSGLPGNAEKIRDLIQKMDVVKQIADRGWLLRVAAEKLASAHP